MAKTLIRDMYAENPAWLEANNVRPSRREDDPSTPEGEDAGSRD
jgi:hypothetical protein